MSNIYVDFRKQPIVRCVNQNLYGNVNHMRTGHVCAFRKAHIRKGEFYTLARGIEIKANHPSLLVFEFGPVEQLTNMPVVKACAVPHCGYRVYNRIYS